MVLRSAVEYCYYFNNVNSNDQLSWQLRTTSDYFRKEGVNSHPRVAIPDVLERTLVDIWEPYNKTSDVPYFWAIPKTGSRSALAYLRMCLQLVEASHKGEPHSNRSDLEVISDGNMRYVNVNIFTSPGIERAVQLNLLSSALMDFVTTDNMYITMARLFTSSNKGARLFAIFRHPVDREVSRFAFMQYATWEKLYDPKLKDMTLEQYIQSGNVYDNWMVRILTGRMERSINSLTDQDLIVAKEVLRRKCLVGLTSAMEESMTRFQSFFGWPLRGIERNKQEGSKGASISGEACRDQFLVSDNGRLNKNKNTAVKLEKESDLWKQIAYVHRLDVELYNYAITLFEEQAPLYKRNRFYQ